MKKLRLDVTSSAFAAADGAAVLESCLNSCRKFGFELGIQLHNTADAAAVDFARKSGLPLSAHAPITGKYSLNLATLNTAAAFNAFEENAVLLRDLHITESVFHGFGMTDLVIPRMCTMSDYKEHLSKLNRTDLLLQSGYEVNRDFTSEPEFITRRNYLKANLKLVREKFPDISFAIENDLPVYGYGGMKIDDMLFLEHPLCLDIGHLWTSSLLLDFDFYSEVEKALGSGMVKMIHFHNSQMDKSIPKIQLRDGHRSLTESYAIDLPRTFNLLMKYRISAIVLEISQCKSSDIDTLASWCE